MRLRDIGIVAMLLVLTLLPGCGGDATAPAVSAITIEPAAGRLVAIDQTLQLRARATAAGGAAVHARLQWSSSEPGVATVDSTGLVRARGRGNATITARAESGVSATALVTVDQEVASIAVTPARDTLAAGQTRRLTAVARDAGGHDIGGVAITWSSSDTTVATVNASGEVRARFRGSATIRARVAAVEGTAQVTVILVDFRPTSNTTLGGSSAYNRFEIPAGVTVTVTSDLIVQALDSLVIAGTLAGDCTAIDMRVRGTMRVTGTVRNTCSVLAGPGRPIRISGDAGMTFTNARIESHGNVQVSNLGTSPGPGGGTRASSLQSTSASSHACTWLNSGLVRSDAAAGRPGSPRGEPGSQGGDAVVQCAGDLTISGSNFAGGGGGTGGAGTATAGDAAVGGKGGLTGRTHLESAQRVVFTVDDRSEGKASNIVVFQPGWGGNARADKLSFPEARGGHAGVFVPPVIKGASIRVDPGALALQLGLIASGGDAEVDAADGADATATRPALAGASAVARGGDAVSFTGPVRIFGDIFQGPVTGAAEIKVTVLDDPQFAKAGRATIQNGSGGRGNRMFKNGGPSGSHTAVGGHGLDVRIWDSRTATYLGTPGDGGSVSITRSFGGKGWDDCVPGALEDGGRGGPGGVITANGGLPGNEPGAPPGTIMADGAAAFGRTGRAGGVFIRISANGGAGGDGVPIGNGGSPGMLTSVIGTPDIADSFEPGQPGNPCGYTMPATITVAPNGDPAGHEPFLNVTKLGGISFRLLPNNGVELRIGGVTLTGTLTQSGSDFTFTASGGGTIAGRTATGTFTNGRLEVDASGRVARVTGRFTFGTGGQLPGGQPVAYDVDARITIAPSPPR